MYKKIYCWLLLACIVTGRATAQTNMEAVLKQVEQTLDMYKNNSLSYQMRYTYANETTPSTLLDSVNGEVEISGTSYRYLLDSTETVSNEKYTIMLFKKDKVMYLARPSKKQEAVNSFAMLDSSLLRVHGLQCAVSMSNTLRTTTFVFPANMQYKQIQFTTDTTTGLIQDVRCIVKTGQMVDPQLSKGFASKDYDEYAIVEVKLYGYKTIMPETASFNETNFFKRNGKEYTAAEKYKDYKIVLATPNL